MKHIETGIPAFRLEDSELLYMRLGEWVVSFEGYKHSWDNKRTLGPARGKQEWCGAKLGLTEQCDFDSNNWHSPRFDFEKTSHYFDDSIGDYPFCPTKKWEDQYMLWESWAWKTNRTIGDNWWSSKAQMEDSVWKQLIDPWNKEPSKLIKDCELTQEDLSLETIHLYKEWDSREQCNEAIKSYHINNLEKQIERIEKIPYGKGI